MTRSRLFALLLTLAMGAAYASPAAACPTCGEANKTAEGGPGSDDPNMRPRAYMYSILFMMGMPPLIFGGFGFAFYRMAKAAQVNADEQALDSQSDVADTDQS